jgi:hypothetical protein
MAQTRLHSLFHLPLSQYHGQMLQLQNILEGVSLNESTEMALHLEHGPIFTKESLQSFEWTPHITPSLQLAMEKFLPK